nr:MAG TPA: hypothetical protein [Caudoviricetes sp.]
MQYFHRFQSIAAQTKRQKFQLRCALYPPPEGRGFTARLIKRHKYLLRNQPVSSI